MESWRRVLAQFRDLLGGMAPSQRFLLVMVPLVVLGALGVAVYWGGGQAEEALLSGKVFSADELKNAEEALHKAGLFQFRVEGQRILVPRSDAARYSAALITGAGLPQRFGEGMEKALADNPLMLSGQQRQALVDLEKARDLVRMFKAIDDIQDASVVPSKSRPRGFGGDARITALVWVKPKAGRDLSPRLVQGLRDAVAASYTMPAAEVQVVNGETGVTYRAVDKDDPYTSEFLDQIRHYESHIHQNIARQLSDIDGVKVAVHVDIDNLLESYEQKRKLEPKPFAVKSSEETDNQTSNESKPASEPGMVANQPRSVRPQGTATTTQTVEKSRVTSESVPVGSTVTQNKYFGLTPKSVQVAVKIPRDHYRLVAIKQGASESDKTALEARMKQVEAETLKDVSATVAKLIPLPATGTAADLISVASYDRLETAEAPPEPSLMVQASEILTHWGGPAALAIFALWALWMLNRSLKSLPQEPAPALSGASAGAGSAASAALAVAAAPAPEPENKEPTRRDKLQTLVRDNPEMAASVLTRWLATTK